MRDTRVVVFCEDTAHERVLRRLIARVTSEASQYVSVSFPSARGGFGTALSELGAFQRAVAQGAIPGGTPDLLVVATDTNCRGARRRTEVEAAIDARVIPRHVLACPDPHVEKWLLADAHAFRQVFGVACPRLPTKCERALYKSALADAVARSDVYLLTGDPLELAPDVVGAMDLDLARRTDESLARFIDDLASSMQRIETETD